MEIQTQLLHKHFHSLLVCLRCPSHLYNIHKITCSLFFFVPSQFNKFFVEASSYIHNSHYNQTSSTLTIHHSSSCSTSKLLRVFLCPHKENLHNDRKLSTQTQLPTQTSTTSTILHHKQHYSSSSKLFIKQMGKSVLTCTMAIFIIRFTSFLMKNSLTTLHS